MSVHPRDPTFAIGSRNWDTSHVWEWDAKRRAGYFDEQLSNRHIVLRSPPNDDVVIRGGRMTSRSTTILTMMRSARRYSQLCR
jgi:hypothetical protein